jgi:hypothetical protein
MAIRSERRNPLLQPTHLLWIALAALAALGAAALAGGCTGEHVEVGAAAGNALAPERAGEPVATRATLEADSAADGSYVSADGLVSGTYDRATAAFVLAKSEDAPLALRVQDGAFQLDPATGAALGARYLETLTYADGRARSYEVELVIGPASMTLTWLTEPEGNTVRTERAELLDDGSWTLAYTDDDPDTAIVDATGSFVVETGGAWTGTYAARWMDGSTLDEDLSSVALRGAAIHLLYIWDDAATSVAPDETGDLLIDPDGRITGTLARTDASGADSCVQIEIAGGGYLELPTDCP